MSQLSKMAKRIKQNQTDPQSDQERFLKMPATKLDILQSGQHIRKLEQRINELAAENIILRKVLDKKNLVTNDDLEAIKAELIAQMKAEQAPVQGPASQPQEEQQATQAEPVK